MVPWSTQPFTLPNLKKSVLEIHRDLVIKCNLSPPSDIVTLKRVNPISKKKSCFFFRNFMVFAILLIHVLDYKRTLFSLSV